MGSAQRGTMQSERNALDRRGYRAFDFRDLRFVTLVKRPLLDSLAAKKAGSSQHAQMFACGGLTDGQFFRDEQPAHAILDGVAVDLRRKMRSRILEPLQNLKPLIIRQCAQRTFHRHLATLPKNIFAVKRTTERRSKGIFQ